MNVILRIWYCHWFKIVTETSNYCDAAEDNLETGRDGDDDHNNDDVDDDDDADGEGHE